MSGLFDLSGRVAIVTGASRGLGQQLARALAGAGADLVVTSRDVARLSDFRRELESLGRRALAVELDVRSEASIEAMMQAAVGEYGRVDVLVNNAGLNIRKPSLDYSWDEYDTVLDTILKGSFFCARAAARAMAQQGRGRIVNIGSATCVFGMDGIVPYTASRGGILQMTRGLAVEWGPLGITVNCLAPGWFRTAQNAVLYDDEEWLAYITDRIPLGRPGQAADLDGAVVFLASDASAYVTGQVLFVDGGFTTGATKAILRRGPGGPAGPRS
jgi:NAD(P)-dependent dehydrogenase (short-subunit alcohol dehydrogenase family)